MKALNKVIKVLRRYFWSLEKQARHSGVKIGLNCFIDSRFWSTEPYLITIGNNCQITADTRIHTHGGGNSVRAYIPKFDCFGKVVIGDYVYLGSGTQVMPGVSIGNNVLIAAGSIVTKSVPNDVVVGGNPARIICTIQEYIKNNAKYNLESKGMSSIEKRNLLLSLSDEKFIKKADLKIK